MDSAWLGAPLFAYMGLSVCAGLAARKALEQSPATAPLAQRLRRALNWLVLWLLMPAVVFKTVHAAPLRLDLVQAPAAAIAGMAGTALVAWAVLGRLYGRTPSTGGLVLAASAGSVSFLGIPLARAFFGAEHAHVAVYFAVLNVPLALAAGAVISARVAHGAPGTGGRPPATARAVALQALRHLAALPASWALVGALALRPWASPAPALAALDALSAVVAPVTMVALGLGLRFERSLAPYRMALPAVAIKLAVSPLVVFACAWAVGLTGSPLAIVAFQGAMPTQVLSVVVAERYRLDPRLVGLTLAMDTVAALLVLPVVVSLVSGLLI